MTDICLAHLVREQNGLAPFEKFIESYRSFPAGIAHKLLIILKGFERREVPEYEDLLSGIEHEFLFVDDKGFDIQPYFAAARSFEYNYFCFLNSFSVILDEGWLLKLYKHIARADAGVVSATGSHESLYDHHMRPWPSPRPLLFWLKLMVRRREALQEAAKKRINFAPFPNYHVRTNAFIIRREVMLKLKVGQLRDKEDAHRFESGRSGLTRQIENMKLKALVVGRDGIAYEKENWCESFTFRSGAQQNLLVADNQTRYYEQADTATRRALQKATWGT
jgi:hypothetical protein